MARHSRTPNKAPVEGAPKKKRRGGGKDKHAKNTDDTLASYGFDYRTDQGRPGATTGFEGRPDVLAVRRRRATYIEIKSAAERFELASWREEQRAYSAGLEAQGESIYLWLNIGNGRPDLKNMRDEKYARRAFLIPIAVFREAIAKAEVIGVKSIPYRVHKKGSGTKQRTVIRDHSFSAADLFGSYELKYSKSGTWVIPVGHPFAEEHELKEPTCQPSPAPDTSSQSSIRKTSESKPSSPQTDTPLVSP